MKEFKTEIILAWSDLDLFGHINNVAYFRFIQQARVTVLENLGVQTNEAGLNSFIVAASSCEFISPLAYPGKITVRTQFEKSGNTSINMVYQIVNEQGAICAKGLDVIVFFDYVNNRKIVVPEPVRVLALS